MTRSPVVHGTLALVLAGSAFSLAAARPHIAAPSQLIRSAERPVEVADGASLRKLRHTVDVAPRGAKPAWNAFVGSHGAWEATWDAATGVPLRIWGEGIASPGANGSADRAATAAWGLLAEQLALIAPGTQLTDWKLITNTVHGGLHGSLPMRTVAFAQHHDGAPVLGASVGFLFKNDRLFVINSTAIPTVVGATPRAPIGLAVAGNRAIEWVGRATGIATQLRSGDGAVRWLPLVRATGAVETRAVVSVEVEAIDAATPGRWQVYLDAQTGAPIARANQLRFATGTVTYRVPTRSPQRPRIDAPVPFTNFRVGTATTPSNAQGQITWTGTAPATVTAALTGPLVAMTNRAGALATASLTLAPGGTVSWDRSTVGTDDAQLSTYIFSQTVKAYAKANLDPELGYLDQQLSASVNESGNCNAYSTGDDIHFYRASTQCENTGRIADVVYHEFGHSLHNQAIIPGVGSFDGGLSEGVSDYLAATITNDSGMGRGFFFNDSPLRELQPARDLRWPDDATGEVHDDGEIIAGTLWDVRVAMIAALGQTAGVIKADDLYYAIIQRASDIPSTYAEALAADDDDGNLANGTPNLCTLREVFGRHGLATGGGAAGSGLGAPVRAGFTVRVPIAAPVGGCAAPTLGTATLSWKLRGGGALANVTMTQQGGELVGVIPAQADGAVVQFGVVVAVNGNPVRFPDNVADPLYEFFVGTVEPIACVDFESDPAWTHSATAGADPWQRGAPTGGGGDPMTATSGTQVYGMDILGGDGVYAPSSASSARTPVISTAGFTSVRLQYKRWLNVEDGFFDQATIAADGATVWSNFNSNQGNSSSTSHTDREWRFHDVDLSAAAADGNVQLTFALRSDQGLELGGWTLDDVCIVGYRAGAAACGNSLVEAGEQCDDGNTVSGDGCSATCVLEGEPPVDCGDGVVDAGEQCDDGNTVGGDGCSAVCTTEATPAGCGDAIVDGAEECDDGNTVGGDGCTSVCTLENGNPGEGDGGGCCSTGSGAGGPLTAAGLAMAVAAFVRRRRTR